MKFSTYLFALSLFISSQLHAATIVLNLDDYEGTTLTLKFANDTDNAAIFTGADFFSREWAGLEALGTNLYVNGTTTFADRFGLFPESSLANTNVSIAGSISSSGNLNFGFRYTETNTLAGYSPFSLPGVTGRRLRGTILWPSGIDGFAHSFYVDSYDYNAFGTANDFVTAASVPAPATLYLLATGLLGLAGVARKKKA